MTAALRTVEQLKAALQAARAHQVYVEDHSPACDSPPCKTDCLVCTARADTDAAFQAVLDALPRPRTP